MTTLLPAIVLVLVAIVILGVKALFVKGGKFPSGHASDIPAIRDKGVDCVRKMK